MAHLVNAPLDHGVTVPAKQAKRGHPEADLQRACITYLKIREKQGILRYHADMPEGKRSAARAGWFKAMGARPGFPDLQVFMPDPLIANIRVILIELKAGSALSPAQKDWRDWFQKHGFEWHCVTSVDQLKEIVG